MLSELQGVVDAVMDAASLPAGTYRVNNHDLEYFRSLFCRKGKKSLTLAASNHAYYRRILMDVLHRVVCGLRYGVEFDMLDGDGKRVPGCIYAEEKKAAPAKSERKCRPDIPKAMK